MYLLITLNNERKTFLVLGIILSKIKLCRRYTLNYIILRRFPIR